MTIQLRIPVTDEQKRAIMDAVADEPNGFAAWARQVLLAAAAEKQVTQKQPLSGSKRVS